MIEEQLRTLAKILREDKLIIESLVVEDALEVILDLKSELEHINYQGDLRDG